MDIALSTCPSSRWRSLPESRDQVLSQENDKSTGDVMSSSLIAYQSLSSWLVPTGIVSRSAAGLSYDPSRGLGTRPWASALGADLCARGYPADSLPPIVGQPGR